MNTYADDLATLLEHLNLRSAMLVGHSTGGGEVARYIGRHRTARISRAVLVGELAQLAGECSGAVCCADARRDRAVSFHRRGMIHDRTFDDQRLRASGLNLAVAAMMS